MYDDSAHAVRVCTVHFNVRREGRLNVHAVLALNTRTSEMSLMTGKKKVNSRACERRIFSR